MPFNGDGTFSPLSPQYPAIAGTVILASDWNAVMADFASGMSNVMCRDGQAAMLANLNMGGFKMRNLSAGTAAQDSVRFDQVFSVPGELLNGMLATTQASNDNSKKLATTEYVDAATFTSALPDQAGNSGRFVTTNGAVASWADAVGSVEDYTALRAYAGLLDAVHVYGGVYPATAGVFLRTTDVASVDNGGTIIVAADGTRWKRAYSGLVNVKWFGCLGDGATDDAVKLQTANDYCETEGTTLFFPEGTYVIKSKVQVSCPWVGVPRKTTIQVPSTFVPSGGDATELNIAIKNKSFAITYNSVTANSVHVAGIDFYIDSALTNFRLGNVKGGVIEDCQFTTATAGSVSACLDLFACVKNLSVRDCSFANSTQNAAGGGAVWIRNITTAGNLSTNDTENILFDRCSFSTTTLDEAVAVYGVRGLTKNVTMRKCLVQSEASAVKHGTLASTFPLNDGYLIGGVSYAAVQGVLWDDCIFIDTNFTNDVLRFGATADVAQPMSDIKARNCHFVVSKPVAGTGFVMRSIRCVGYGMSAQDCHINADASVVAITYGFGGFDLVTGCTTSGSLTNATYTCKVVADNPRLVGATGATDCTRVQGNRIYSTSTGIICSATDEYGVIGNYIEAGATGVIFNTLGGATTPAGDAIDNRIVMSAAASFALIASGTTGRLRARGNKVSGVGKTISGTTWKEIQGNDWYGTLDSSRAAGYIDFDHNNASPIGTFAAISAPVTGTSRISLGWIKKANAGVAGDWQAVFPETANN